MPARFYEQGVQSGLKEKRRLAAYLDSLVLKHLKQDKKPSLSYIFCTDEHLADMNMKFLDHDTYTDIITFDLTGPDGILTGEIYISTERVADNAAKFETAYDTELHRVIFHGALHLCGFKDKNTADKQLMRQMEDKCLKEYLT